MKTIFVPGTWSWNPNAVSLDWFERGSPFVHFVEAEGVTPLFGDRPFVWDTSLGGIGRRPHTGWQAAGLNLFDYAVPPLCPQFRIPPAELGLLVHSHGLQVALYALAAGLKCATLVSVGSPVRKDMMAVARQTRLNIGYWLHIHSDSSDRWQVLGALFDGKLGIVRAHPLADLNDFVPGVGHSELLRDPACFSHWSSRQWLSHLKG